jgi:hypothetical protein
VKPLNKILVFGSNLVGNHRIGAALYARKHYGAELGVCVGRTGRAYAIPTRDANGKILPVNRIRKDVENFLAYAQAHPELVFQVPALGTEPAGYSASVIMPLFKGALTNCELPEGWVR